MVFPLSNLFTKVKVHLFQYLYRSNKASFSTFIQFLDGLNPQLRTQPKFWQLLGGVILLTDPTNYRRESESVLATTEVGLYQYSPRSFGSFVVVKIMLAAASLTHKTIKVKVAAQDEKKG